MTKELHKVFLKRSKVRNKFLKSRTLSDFLIGTLIHRKEIFVKKSLLRTYFNNLDIRKVTDNQKYWKTAVPLFPNKFSTSKKINVLKRVSVHVYLNKVTLPVHKKEINSDKANYSPISILPNLPKSYEKLMYQQLYEHLNSIFSPKKCEFRRS